MAVLEPSESPTKANRAGKDGRGQEGELGQCMACQGRCVTASSGWARQGWQVRWVMDGPVGASLFCWVLVALVRVRQVRRVLARSVQPGCGLVRQVR